jgi:hypothetical protein
MYIYVCIYVYTYAVIAVDRSNLYMYVCMYVYMYILTLQLQSIGRICICMYACMYICIYVCMSLCVAAYIHICVYVFADTELISSVTCVYMYVNAYVHVTVNSFVRWVTTYIHTYIHIYTQQRDEPCTYIHTYVRAQYLPIRQVKVPYTHVQFSRGNDCKFVISRESDGVHRLSCRWCATNCLASLQVPYHERIIVFSPDWRKPFVVAWEGHGFYTNLSHTYMHVHISYVCNYGPVTYMYVDISYVYTAICRCMRRLRLLHEPVTYMYACTNQLCM